MKVLLITQAQFGYLIDYQRYFHFLRSKGYRVFYICFDQGRPKVEPDQEDVYYVSGMGSKPARLLRMLRTVRSAHSREEFDRILVHYFLFVSALLLFLPRSRVALDIRTVSIHAAAWKRKLFDRLIRFAAGRFREVTILNDLSARHLGIRKYRLLPLGGARFSEDPVDPADERAFGHLFRDGRRILLYVGTLNKRRMIDCVAGLHAYLKKYPDAPLRMILIGQGFGQELQEIRDYVAKHGLDEVVFAPGFLPQSRLSIFFRHADIGICYVPVTPFFRVQPSTKTYEYLINGIPVLATRLPDNERLISGSPTPCGVLIEDSPAGFERGLDEILGRSYDGRAIAEAFRHYEWDQLLHTHLLPLFNDETRIVHRA